ncbi:DUF3024 domain-containing protein [Paenibacillus doosanensis]|uniref:DUF3024 domain-containing protein n=1 Tax=Paenibacillus doosanensis TaxID=1229154 RepID=UPI00217F7102|nr:DUF3024 domain-containing protein [Paenibacillus doosanensis]MCS7464494.1 DUF3024 domain-containing protein [Paenibacillus doosanensis]
MDRFTIRRLENILDGYIALKVPRDVRSSVRLTYQWDENRLTLREERPDDHGRKWLGAAIVQFRLEQSMWHVYAKDGDNAWQIAASIAPHSDFERQLEQVELDREGIFWIS